MNIPDNQSVTFKVHDDSIQKSSSITVNIGDRYVDGVDMVWQCRNISCGHVTFVSITGNTSKCYILTFEETEMILQCPVYDWTRISESVK